MVNVLSLLKAIVSQIFVKRIERSFTSFFMVCWGRLSILFLFASVPIGLPSNRRPFGSAWQLGVSQVEWELVEIHVARDRANFTAEASDLVSQHARSWDLDGIVPIVVIVTKRIGEVQDGHLRDLWRILRYIEVSRLHWTLSNRVRNQEEVEFAIDYFWLLYKAIIDVGTLWWVINEILTASMLRLLEESLADSLINDDQSDLRSLLGFYILIIESIF